MSMFRKVADWLRPKESWDQPETAADCAKCGGDMQPGRTDTTIESDGKSVVIAGIPAMVCSRCGNAMIGNETYAKLPDIFEEAVAAGRGSGKREFTTEWKESQ